MESKPKTIVEMQREAKDHNKSGKCNIIPKNYKPFKKNGKVMNLPTEVEITKFNK